MAIATPGLFRRCAVTGLEVDRSAEKLIKFHAVTAVLFLAFGGFLALCIALTRWEAVHLLSASRFYEFVSAHGMVMLIFWIIFFEMAGLIFGSTILLSTKMLVPKLGWAVYGMMLGGSLVATWMMITGRAVVMFTSYPPLKAPALYYAAVLVFAVGAILGCVHFFINIVGARLRGDVTSLPLFSFALAAAAIIALWSLISGAAALIPAFLWAAGLIPSVDPGVYRLLYWGLGHGAQQINLAAMVAIWYGLASLTTGAKPLNEGLSRFAIVLYIFFINMGSIHHLLADPGLTPWFRNINTSYMMYLAVLGSLIHGFSIPASIELGLREQGFRKGLFGWLRRAPWGEPGFAALAVSLFLFGVMGGISGVIIGGPQVNLIMHNTLLSPSHFHMTVVTGTTIAFMGLSYYLVPLIFQRELVLRGFARWQPYIYGAGMVIWAAGMGLAGHWGVPRRHWDITFSSSVFPLKSDIFENRTIDVFLALLGIGGILAVIGGAMFVAVIVGTVFTGKRSATPYLGKIMADTFAPVPVVSGASGEDEAVVKKHKEHEGFETPGALVLALIYLALFVGLYGFSWFELSKLPWGVH